MNRIDATFENKMMPVSSWTVPEASGNFCAKGGRFGTTKGFNGLPPITPPWSEIVAFDLNEGTIKWHSPLGVIPELAAKGITNTGSWHPDRNGITVTAGGLIFMGTLGDATFRAFDKDNGKVLWEKKMESNPEGIPAIYEVDGRQYVAFFLHTNGEPSLAGPGKPEAQGYCFRTTNHKQE